MGWTYKSKRYRLHFDAQLIYVYILKRVVDRILQILGGDSVDWNGAPM